MRLDERGKQCPLPVVETRKALEAAGPGETIEVVVDNEIAVQNLRKMADHKGLEFRNGGSGVSGPGSRGVGCGGRTGGRGAGCGGGPGVRPFRRLSRPRLLSACCGRRYCGGDLLQLHGPGGRHPGEASDEGFHLCPEPAGTAAADRAVIQRRGVSLLRGLGQRGGFAGAGGPGGGDSHLRHLLKPLRPGGKAAGRRGDEHVRNCGADDRRQAAGPPRGKEARKSKWKSRSI